MSLNYVEINYLIKELNLTNSFIQKCIQPDYKSFILKLYNRERGSFNLFISLENQLTRINETLKTYKNFTTLPRFILFSRAKIEGSKIKSVKQINNERIILLLIENREAPLKLYIKLWPTAANIIVCNEADIILDCIYRRPQKGEISKAHFKIEKSEENVKREQKYTLKEGFNFKISTYSHFIENYYEKIISEKREREKNLESSKLLKSRKEREEKIKEIKSKILKLESLNLLKEKGKLILENLNNIKTSKVKINTCNLTISLDPSLSAIENAQKYFREYKKSKNSLKALRELLKKEEHLLESQELIVSKESNENNKKQIKSKVKKIQLGRVFKIKDFEVVIGRSAKENDELLRKYARGSDIWIHTRDFPGAYTFLRSNLKTPPPLEVLISACNLCIYYTKRARKEKVVSLYYTKVKYLRRVKNAKRGNILVSQEKNLNVTLDEKIIKNLIKT